MPKYEIAVARANGGVSEWDGYILRDLRRQRNLVWILVALLPMLLPLLLLVGTGFYGLDFGFHWDEGLLLKKVRQSIDSGILLPENFYNYPSMSYWLTFAGSGLGIVEALQGAEEGAGLSQILGGDSFGIRSNLSIATESQTNLLRVRGLFLIVSSLAVVWVYLLQLAWRQSWIEALLAASILALSWEVAYHLRWIAPDALLMQFAALTILLVMLVRLRPEHSRIWLRLAAVAAGLACGTKYQAGLLLVPVLIAAFQAWDRNSIRKGLLLSYLEVLFLFGFTYLLTTPGTVLAPLEFARDVFFESEHYQTGHVGHTVSAGMEHLRLNLSFFTLSLFSRYELIALIFALFAGVGVYALVVESRSMALLFLSFPILYLLVMITQRVMILRNLLLLAPFFAILSARGIAFVWEQVSDKYVRMGLATVVVVMLLVNAAWLIYSAETIYNRSPERFINQTTDYINDHPESLFFVSDMVWDDLNTSSKDMLSNITRDPHQGADRALFYISEGKERPIDWPTNRRDMTITWFGPYEVNFNYYSGWKGDDRILLMSMDTARESGILVVQ